MINANIDSFLKVAQMNSFTKAAGSLYLTRQAVSSQIKQLEAFLKVKLFIRSASGIELSPAGKLCFDFFSAEQKKWDKLNEQLRRQPEHIIRIGCVFEMDAESVLAQAMSDFYRMHPGVEVLFENDDSETILTSLDDGFCDIAIVRGDCRKLEKAGEDHIRLSLSYLETDLIINMPEECAGEDFFRLPCYAVNNTVRSDEEFCTYYRKLLKKNYQLNFSEIVILPNRESVLSTIMYSKGAAVLGRLPWISSFDHLKAEKIGEQVPLIAVYKTKSVVPFRDDFIRVLSENIKSEEL